ncbi:MAG: hypothetical protein HFE73_08410 [Firmicutes bacterium]|nr:hypothetical protein [Bacillota bacterium]
MISTKFTPYGKNIMTVRVVSYEKSCIKGTLSCSQMKDDIEFTGAISLLLNIEQIMDMHNSPQRGEEPRSFGADSCRMPFTDNSRQRLDERKQALATFQINVMFRQNATWQGRLFWADENMEASFRSVLELIRLLDSALGEKATEQRPMVKTEDE